jgi:mannitol-1-phosphate 5-dehydrogenase
MNETSGKTFVGFGFGPIQAGLFAYEAQRSGCFSRYVIAEVNSQLVQAVRQAGGTCRVNVAQAGGVDVVTLEGLELCDPAVEEDRRKLVEAITESDEMATCLPSVEHYDAGDANSVVRLLAEGLGRRDDSRPTVIYTAENHGHAAETLSSLLKENCAVDVMSSVQIVDTVIGKMSGLIDPLFAGELNISPLAGHESPAVLVEAFNRILISEIKLDGYQRGIECFAEKGDLSPFADAKLHGHNAVHALIGYLADLRVYETIAKAGDDEELMDVARGALLEECGPALLARHGPTGDELFTPEGWREHAEDLLDRMVNPHLHDLTVRICRDPVRKLGYDDRLYGTMRLCLREGIVPRNMALGAGACIISMILRGDEIPDLPETVPADPSVLTPVGLFQLLLSIWGPVEDEQTEALLDLTWEAIEKLKRW